MTTPVAAHPEDGFSSSAALSGELVRRVSRPRTRIEASAPTRRQFRVDLADGVLAVEVIGEEPDWLYPVLAAVHDYSFYPHGWDSYGGEPLTFKAACAGLAWLAEVLPPTAAAPAAVPGSDGGIQFEWHNAVGDLEVAVAPDGRIHTRFESADGMQAWESDDAKDARMRQAVQQL